MYIYNYGKYDLIILNSSFSPFNRESIRMCVVWNVGNQFGCQFSGIGTNLDTAIDRYHDSTFQRYCVTRTRADMRYNISAYYCTTRFFEVWKIGTCYSRQYMFLCNLIDLNKIFNFLSYLKICNFDLFTSMSTSMYYIIFLKIRLYRIANDFFLIVI